jgi:plastocyanin/mono/diheme cytochrome c family protein
MPNVKRPFAIFAVFALICAVGIPAWAIWKRGSPSAAMEPIAGSDKKAQVLFQTNCGACHTLAAGGTDGVVGPNLDIRFTGQESKTTIDANCLTILQTIENGLGGRMPAGILEGDDARLVANFVARNIAYVNPSGETSTEVSPSQVKCQAPSAPSKPAPSKPQKPKQAAPSGGPSKLTVAADPTGQLAFDQTSLTAQAGNVTVDFTNQAPLQHDFCIQQGSSDLGCTSTIQGASTTKTFNNLKSGTYTFYCSVDGHEAAGMKGTLTVK